MDSLELYFFDPQQAQEDDEEAGTCNESESETESIGDVCIQNLINLEEGTAPPTVHAAPEAVIAEEAEHESRISAAQTGNQHYLWLALATFLFALIIVAVISVSICVGMDQCHGFFQD